jgi:rhodanese-related sulfurtransferase
MFARKTNLIPPTCRTHVHCLCPSWLRRLAELPRDVEIVAYCRGPFCLMSDEAVKLLQAHGYRARKTFDGVSEWQAAGLPTCKKLNT